MAISMSMALALIMTDGAQIQGKVEYLSTVGRQVRSYNITCFAEP